MFKILVTSALATLIAGAAGAAVTTFSDSGSFNAALPGATTSIVETFDGAASGNVLNFSGVTSTYNPNGNGFATHQILGGRLDLFIEGDAPITMDWALPSDVIAIGFDVFDANSSAFDGVVMTINDGSGAQSFSLFDVAGGTGSTTDGYVGFIGANTFSSVSFTGPGGFGSSGDALDFDNLQIVTQTAVVPLPAAGWMLFAGVGAVTALRRRKQA